MSKHILKDELYEDYTDEENCFGKMYNADATECPGCGDKEDCQAAAKADTVLKASQADPAQVYDDSDGFSREGAVEFILNRGKDAGVEFEKVEMKTRDKLYYEDRQVFLVTNKHLKCTEASEGTTFQLEDDEWEAKGKGFVVELENEGAIRTLVRNVLNELGEPVEEETEEPVEGKEKEETSSETMETFVQETEREESPEPITVGSPNLDGGFGVYFGNNGIVKVEIYIRRDSMDKSVLMEKIEQTVDGFLET